MDNNRKDKLNGIAGTVLLHGILLLILWLCYIRSEVRQEESGVPVMIGTQALAQGGNYRMTEVDVHPQQPAVTEPQPAPEEQPEELIVQEEESVSIEEKRPTPSPKEQKRPDTPAGTKPQPKKTEEQKRKEAEQAAAEQAARSIAGAFGKGAAMNSQGDAGSNEGSQGSPDGNSNTGKTSGTGGYGDFDLNGRSLGKDGLPKPDYYVQDEGIVVVTITVNPSGQVTATSINKLTTTVNPALRRAAEEAARKARFNSIEGVNNQVGTITYRFNLK